MKSKVRVGRQQANEEAFKAVFIPLCRLKIWPQISKILSDNLPTL